MRNYFEHEETVKYMDGILEHSENWQWFINLIETNFDSPRCETWDDFICDSIHIREVFARIVKLQSICDKEFTFSIDEFKEIWQIAKFYNGSIDYDTCNSNLKSTFSKILLFCTYITKVYNASFEKDFVFNISPLVMANYFEFECFDQFYLHKEKLLKAAEALENIPNFNIPLQILKDNLTRNQRTYDNSFFEENEKNLVNYNSIHWNKIDTSKYNTWQEKFLLDMLNVSLTENSIIPAFTKGTQQIPDVSEWSKPILEKMKHFFHHPSANFVIETIQYFIDGTIPSIQTKTMHLAQLNNEFDCNNLSSIMSSSSFFFISKLMKDRELQNCKTNSDFLSLLQKFHKIDDAETIEKLSRHNWYISQEQTLIRDHYNKEKFRKILKAEDFNAIHEYVADKTTAPIIDNECFNMLIKKFYKSILTTNDISVSALFCDYMHYLLAMVAENASIDKRTVKAEMIHVQKTWSTEYFQKQSHLLRETSFRTSIPKDNIELFNKYALQTPILVAKYCFPSSNDEILQTMCDIAQHPFDVLFKTIQINEIFPLFSYNIDTTKHDIDTLLLQIIEVIIAEKGYKLLNQLTAEEFLRGLHKSYRMKTEIILPLFYKIHELYDSVSQCSNYELIPFSNKLSLAMVTQLFPVLEVKIRELAELFGLFPFKKDQKTFMIYNDPSSLIRELITMAYKESKSLENIPDFLFIYNVMYNSNSLNIRNECIHGRNYGSGEGLHFAFIATLFSIHMVDYRINRIKSISDNNASTSDDLI